MKFWLTLTSSVLISSVILSVLPVMGEDAIYSDVIRLHVIAESDSGEDQALKLEVRDAVISLLSPKFESVKTYAEAYSAVESAMAEIKSTAEAVLLAAGEATDVSVSLGVEKYPRREYEGLTLPAGAYNSLRVEIGEASGRNWWCVLFPSMCIRYAKGSEGEVSARDEEAVAASFTPEEYRMITGESGKYRVKLKILEIFSEIFDLSR